MGWHVTSVPWRFPRFPLSMRTHHYREVLLKFRVNRVIVRTTTMKRSTRIIMRDHTLTRPLCVHFHCNQYATHHKGRAFKTPAKQSKHAQQQYKDPPLFHHAWLYTDPSLKLCVHVFKHYMSPHLYNVLDNFRRAYRFSPAPSISPVIFKGFLVCSGLPCLPCYTVSEAQLQSILYARTVSWKKKETEYFSWLT